jgi:hypothetical protein
MVYNSCNYNNGEDKSIYRKHLIVITGKRGRIMAGKKGKSGRPVSPDAKREVFQVRLTPEEKAMLEKKAQKAGGTIANYIREKTGIAGAADAFGEKET